MDIREQKHNITIGEIVDTVVELALERVLAKLEEREKCTKSDTLQTNDD